MSAAGTSGGHRPEWRNRLARAAFRLPWVRWRWERRFRAPPAGEIPWQPLPRPLRECRLAVVTTGGVHLRDDPPFDMSDPDGDPSWRAVPADAAPDRITITHDYYDHRDADRDLNLVLPLERLAGLVGEGRLGGLAPTAYSLMGHIDGRHVTALTEVSAPELARRMLAEGAEAALLVPA